jgi:hypothetical protein
VVALDIENLLFNILGIVVPASLMLLNSFFENVEFVLIGALLGVPFEPRPKEPQDSDREDDVPEIAANVPRDDGAIYAAATSEERETLINEANDVREMAGRLLDSYERWKSRHLPKPIKTKLPICLRGEVG